MEFFPIKTRPLNPPQDDLFEVIDKYLLDVKDWDIIFITSKVVSIHQWDTIYNDWKIEKEDLIRQEAKYMVESDIISEWKSFFLTIKDNILIASAWIDESNANGYFILWPKKPVDFAQKVHKFLCDKYSIKKLWVIITDSATKPLKLWVVGIAMASYWIEPLNDKRGQNDIFWKKLAVTQVNIIDALAPAAVFLMWEANETQPIVIARDVPWIVYNEKKSLYDEMEIRPEEDLYWILLKPLINKK